VVIRLVPKRSTSETPLPRLWLVFFGEAASPAWWRFLLKPGFRHVSAAAWYDEQQRWVWFNPTWRGTVIELYGPNEFDARMGQLASDATAVLRVRSRFDRAGAPAVSHCVGAVKALLGIRSVCVSPFGLFRHLLANEAEIVEVPGGGAVQQAGCSERGSEHYADARSRAGAG
jgi:hypothetical protein